MYLLQSGIDLSVIAMWLGHESISTTHHYLHADMALKMKALGKMGEQGGCTKKFIPKKDVLTFVDAL